MLRVTLEVVPLGDEEKKYTIGSLSIANEGCTDVEAGKLCEYSVWTHVPYKGGKHFNKAVTHLREDGAWALVRKALSTLSIEGP